MTEEGAVVVKLLLVILIIGTIVLISISFFTKGGVYHFIYGNGLTPDEETKATKSLDTLAGNIRACAKTSATDCICDGFPTYPSVFTGKPILAINHTDAGAMLNLNYDGNPLNFAILENIKIGAITKEKENVPFSMVKSIDFRYEPARFVQAGYVNKARQVGSVAVISAYLYKGGGEIRVIIGKEGENASDLEKLKKCV